jgi:flagella basal body P-ring formation protein FlgA
MLNDKILSQNDYEVYRVKIENLPSNLISCKIEKNLITKSYIRADSLLTYNQVEIKKDVLKGALIRSYIIDGGLVIGMDTILQEDANIGDKIRVKTNQNKFLDAKLFSKTEAMILK